MISGATVCYNSALLGAICPLNFTGNATSLFGTLNPVPVLVSCTFQDVFRFQNSMYISILLIFVASSGMRCSSYDILCTRFSGVLRGSCFRCSFIFLSRDFW